MKQRYSLKITLRPVRYLVGLLVSFACLGAIPATAQIALPYVEDFSGISAADGFPSPSGGSWARTGTTTLQPTYITNQTSYNRIGRGDTKFMSFRYGQATGGNAYTVGPFALTASTTYQVSVWYIADGLTGFGPLSLTYGTGTSVASQSNTIVSVPADITNTTYTQMSGTFTPATSGSYYIGIVCEASSNPWYLSVDDFSVASVPPCSGTPTPGIATTFSPIAVTGFNADVIANGVGSASTTTTADVDGGGYYFLDSTYQYTSTGAIPTYALPANGIINSAATPGLTFKLQSASSNNSLRIATTSGSGTLTLATPVTATNLYLLATSGTGAATVDVTVTFTTSATQSFTGISIADWFGGTPIAIAPVGRVTATNTQDGTSTNPRLYQISLPISASNASLNIASITVTRTSTAGYVQVLAVSATTKTPAAVCAGNGPKVITMANPPGTSGNTYQWQESSVLGGPYTNVTTGSGGTTPSYTTPALTATKYYVLKITCTNSTLSALTNEVAIVVNPQPTLSVTSLPASSNICGTGSVSLTASGNGTSYAWSPATGLSAVNIANPVATPAATTTYTVTATNSSGCTSTATKTVSVYSLTTITAKANPSTLCAGGNTTLTAVDTSFGSATAPTNYTNGTVANPTTDEDFGTITFGPLSNTTTCGSLVGTIGTATGTAGSYSNFTAAAPVTFYAGSTYPLSLSSITCGTINYSNAMAVYIDYNQNGVFTDPGETVYSSASTTSGPHTETATPTIPANAKPGVTRLRVIVNESSVVSGPQLSPSYGEIEDYSVRIIKTATITAATGYTWSPGTFLASTTGSPASVTGITSTTSYTVTGVDANGCSATAVVAVTVNPLPTLAVTPAVASICGVGSVALTASGTAVSYSWSPATGLSATTGASVTANPTTTTTYTVTATGANGCVNTATVTVSVNPLPTIAISPATPTTFCAGSSISLTASGGLTYSWSPAVGLSAATGATVTASPTTTTTYTVTGTDANGCTNTDTKLITINPLPSVTVTPSGSTSFCGSGSVVLTASGTATSYSWSPAAGLSASTGSPVTASPTATTTYTLSGTDANGCVNTATQLITVSPIPTVTISPATAITICSGTGVALTAGGASTYSWSPSSSLSSGTGATVTASPATTTTYTVTGTGAGGCTATATKTITVNPSPSLTISPAAATAFCIGGSVALTVSGSSTAYSWTPATGLSATTGATVTATPTATTTYTVSSTAANGCTGTATKLITVNPLPTINVSPATATSVCLGSGVLLTASGAATYSWTPATGLSAGTGTAVTATPAATITYTVTGTDLNGCSNSATKLVTVNGLPTVSVSPATTSTICAGFSVALTASGAVSYSWSPATGLSATTGAAVTASPTVTTTYTVTGTNAIGCSSTATKTINVNPLPTVFISPATASVICAGSGIVLTASGASTYAWTPATGLSAATGATVTASPAASINYTVTGTDVNGCVNTASRFVTVNGLPTITVSPSTPSTICEGLSVTLTAAGASTYSWSPATGLSATTGAVVAASPTVTTTYTVTGTNTNGCSNTATKTVTVTPKPVADITPAGYITLCQYDSVTLVATPGYASYVWMIYGTAIPFAVNSNLTTVTGGFYTLKVTDISGCIATTATPTVITIDQLPIPFITAKSNVLDAGPGYASYLWYFNGNAITGATSRTFTPTQNGTYTVAVTENNSTCPGKSLPFEFAYVGVGGNVPVSNAIRLYPNPANDILNIDAPIPVSVTVSSMDGKQILFNADAHRINISEWADGVYRVVIRDRSGAYLKMEKITKLAK